MASGDIVGIIGMIVPPATNAASEDTRPDGNANVNHLPVWDFDDTTEELLCFYGRLEGYAGGGLTASWDWSATSATTGVVNWTAGFRRIEDDAEDMDSGHSYDLNSQTDTTASASGERSRVSIAFTSGSDMDNLANGESFVFMVTRNSTGNTLTGDAEMWAFTLTIKET